MKTLAVLLLLSLFAVADGSDPMPLCRQGKPGCPPKLQEVRDGGPLPICPPRCIPYGGPNCGKCGTHLDYLTRLR